jgi:hypothetical protein
MCFKKFNILHENKRLFFKKVIICLFIVDFIIKLELSDKHHGVFT